MTESAAGGTPLPFIALKNRGFIGVRAVANNPIAIYLGCVGLVVGGLGAVVHPLTSGPAPSSPLFVQTALVAPSSTVPNWFEETGSGTGAVAFHDEMIRVLAPIRAEDDGTVAPEPATPVAAAPGEFRKDGARDTFKVKAVGETDVREKATKDKKAKNRTAARPRKPDNALSQDDVEDDPGPQEVKGRTVDLEGRGEPMARQQSRARDEGRDRGQRRVREEPAEREEARDPVEVREQVEVRGGRGGYRYRVEREPENRGFMQDGFRIFGPFYER